MSSHAAGLEPQQRSFIDALYSELLHRGVEYFLPASRLEIAGSAGTPEAELKCSGVPGAPLELQWLGYRYRLFNEKLLFTGHEQRLLESIGRVLAARYHLLMQAELAARGYDLFRGLAEDRYVSAFLDPAPYVTAPAIERIPDRITEAIDTLRVSSLSTYENRRISTGALLFGSEPDPCHELPGLPPAAIAYTSALTSIRSFHRLADGLQTLALVDGRGLLTELIDIRQWAVAFYDRELPVPSSTRYEAHCRATLCGGHVGLVLTPNGEIKIFAGGVQVFNFLQGRWRLTNAVAKYKLWQKKLGESKLAERLFAVALNLAEERRGGLLVVLDDPSAADRLLTARDLLGFETLASDADGPAGKDQLFYLLAGKNALDLPPAVLETVARIDGAIVLDRAANLIAFGAILRHTDRTDRPAIEGGRTAAAIDASAFGCALKVSEDGTIAFYRAGRLIWEM